MLPIRALFFLTFAVSTASIAENHAHAPHQHHEQDEDCPICMEVPTSQQMMCKNGHSMGCVSCVEGIAAQAADRDVEPTCPICREPFDLARVKEQAANKAQSVLPVEQVPQIQPIVDREALIRQIIEQERQNLLADLGEVGLRQIKAEHLDALRTQVRNEMRATFTREEVLKEQKKERAVIIDEIRIEVRRQLIEEERQSLLRELGDKGRRQIREEHLQALRKEVRDSITQRQVQEAQEQERETIKREVRAELRRQQEASIRKEQRTLAQTGKLVLIKPSEQAQIEQDELQHMQGEERTRIRQAHRAHIIRDRVQLISDREREGILQSVFSQLQQVEIARKTEATNARRKSIERNFYMKNGLIWLANFVPFMNIAYYNYFEDVQAELRLQEAQNPA